MQKSEIETREDHQQPENTQEQLLQLKVENEQLRRKLGEIRNSWSWKATGPLRYLYEILVKAAGKSRLLIRDSSYGFSILRKEGLSNFTIRLYWYLNGKHLPQEIPGTSRYFKNRVKYSERRYSQWIRKNDTLSDEDLELIHKHIDTFYTKPRFSVLIPVPSQDTEKLNETLESVTNQIYDNFEICMAVSRSAADEIQDLVLAKAADDPRINFTFPETDSELPGLLNTSIGISSGDWAVFIEAGDMIPPHALYMIANEINNNAGVEAFYSDNDFVDSRNRRSNPYFKPDWDYDLFLQQNYVKQLFTCRTDIVQELSGFREDTEEACHLDLVLRLIEKYPDTSIQHIPFILYHQRKVNDSSLSSAVNSGINSLRVLNDHFRRTEQEAQAIEVPESGYTRIRRSLPEQKPLVSVIIPTKDLAYMLNRCIDGILNRTDYKNLEIIIIENGSSEKETFRLYDRLMSFYNITIVEDQLPFNFSRLANNGARASSGDILLLLNNDTDIINPDWLDEMVSHAVRSEVGAVGAKLYYSNNTIQHGGVILGLDEVAGHVHRLSPHNFPGYFNRLRLSHSLTSVTGACIATRRDIYDRFGGYNEKDLPVGFSDIDYCLRLYEAGYKIIWTPYAELYHYENISRGQDITKEKIRRFNSEKSYMYSRWDKLIYNDPFYNPNLTLEDESFQPAKISRVNKPWMD